MKLSFASLLDMHLDALRKRATAPVRIAVLDTGVDSSHPLLKSRIVASGAIAVDGDEISVVETKLGVDNDVFGHGTSVASIVARTAPNAEIIDVRVLDAQNHGSADGIAAGMRYAIENGARMLNMSLAASASDSALMLEALEEAYENNVIVIAAQKNFPIGDDGLPAQLSGSIGVGNDPDLKPNQWTFVREHIEVSACGENVEAAARGGGYTRVTGTSFATPFIAGICCLAVGASPELTAFEMKTLLKHWAKAS